MATAPLMANALLTANALSTNPGGRGPREPREAEGYAPEREAGGYAPRGENEEPKRGLFDRLDEWFWRLGQRELEARLADATDIHDLEMRIRAIERGGTSWWH
jgi:hypothetical protein